MTNRKMMNTTVAALAIGTALVAPASVSPARAATAAIEHVLLISIDGLHDSDLVRYIKDHPTSALAAMAKSGVHYSKAYAPFPSDSFPGLAALITGAGPKTHGFYYDHSYSRALSPAGSDCKTKGAEVNYTEDADVDAKKVDGGGGLDPKKLPRDPANGCVPVYPHSYLKVNTIFEVAKAAGKTTAWSDKHPVYEFTSGPSGKGVDDLFLPEIAAGKMDKAVAKISPYDDSKVNALIYQMNGFDHTGSKAAPVPALFGMNFQAVSVAQKYAGYKNAQGEFTEDFTKLFEHTDASLGKLMAVLKAKKLADSTLIIITAKHGQAPNDRSKLKIVDEEIIPGIVNGVQKDLLAEVSADDVALIYLTDQSKTKDVVKALMAKKKEAAIGHLYSTAEITKMFADPAKDSRVPDIIIQPVYGTVYAGLDTKKIAEHGGNAEQDRHIGMIVSMPGMMGRTVSSRVETSSVAPTILKALGLNPQDLQGVVAEKTPILPGLYFDK